MAENTNKPNPFLRAALFYALRLGWPVFPLKPRSKDPLVPHGFKDASLDEKQILAWWTKWPNANVATPTGVKHWVMDGDSRNGCDESMMLLVAAHGALNDTLMQITGGGGWQRFYELPDQMQIGCHTGLWDGIDVKGKGGYVVLPPSIHPSGKPYVWDGSEPMHKQAIAPANSWVLDAIAQRANGHHASQGPFELPPKLEKGTRHPHLFKMGCVLRRKGGGHDEILAVLLQINQSRCEPPYDRQHIEELAADICKRYPAGDAPNGGAKPAEKRPLVLPVPRSVKDLREAQLALPEPLIEDLLPRRGVALMTGAQRSGKTIFAAQVAIALATNTALFGNYRLRAPGGVIVMEKDDPAGDATFKDIYERSDVPGDAPIDYYGKEQILIPLGQGFCEWLEIIIPQRKAVAVVLDSYTALRGERKSGIDIVRLERDEVAELDALGKKLGCLVLLLHHESITTRANGALDWDARGAGTYGMSMAAECQIAICRYRELAIDSPERLLRFRSRHMREHQMTLTYSVKTGLFDHVVDGRCAPFYPLIYEIKRAIHTDEFTPRELEEPLGISRATAFRNVANLVAGGALWRTRSGGYRWSPEIERLNIVF